MKIIFYSKSKKIIEHFQKRAKNVECIVVNSYSDFLVQTKNINIVFIDFDNHPKVINKIYKDKIEITKVILSKGMSIKDIKNHQRSDISADRYLKLPIEKEMLRDTLDDLKNVCESNSLGSYAGTGSGIIAQTIKEYKIHDRTISNLDSTLNLKIQNKFDTSILKKEETFNDVVIDSNDDSSEPHNIIGDIEVDLGEDSIGAGVELDEDEDLSIESSPEFEMEEEIEESADLEFSNEELENEDDSDEIEIGFADNNEELLDVEVDEDSEYENEPAIKQEVEETLEEASNIEFSSDEDNFDDELDDQEEVDLEKEFKDEVDFADDEVSELIEIDRTIVDNDAFQIPQKPDKVPANKTSVSESFKLESLNDEAEKTVVDERANLAGTDDAATILVDKNELIDEDSETIIAKTNQFGPSDNGIFKEEEDPTQIGAVEIDALSKSDMFPREMSYKKSDNRNDVDDEDEKTVLLNSKEVTALGKKLDLTEMTERITYDKEIASHNQNEFLRVQSTIRVLREDREKLILENEKLNKIKEEYDQKNLSVNAEIEDLRIELSIVKKRNSAEIEELNYKRKISEEKKSILEEKFKRSNEEINVLNNKVRIDLQAIKQREKELESQLELVTMDSAAQVQSRDNKILELKRKIDSLEFNMENLVIREQRYREEKKELEERMQKIMRTLRGSISLLEDDMNIDDELLNKIKDL